MQKLDGILDSQNMLVPLFVYLVYHGGQRRGFPGTRRAGNQDNTARLAAKLLDDCWQSELFEGQNVVGNGSEYGANCAALVEDVCAKSGQALQSEREVKLEVLFESMFLGVRQHRVSELFGLCRGEGPIIIER